MTNSAVPPPETLKLDLLDIQKNLNALIWQLSCSPQRKYHPQGAAALMTAMAYKLTQLSRRIYH